MRKKGCLTGKCLKRLKKCRIFLEKIKKCVQIKQPEGYFSLLKDRKNFKLNMFCS